MRLLSVSSHSAAFATALLALPVLLSSAGATTVLIKSSAATLRASAAFDSPSMVRHGFTPNDPYFSNQWHLANTSGMPHVNVEGAWSRGLTGAGVTIGIVDDGLDWTHPDLAPAYSAADSRNFGSFGLDLDPGPRWANTELGSWDGDNHGTAVAGVAGARGGNGIGGTGAAPMASLAGLRVDFRDQDIYLNQFAEATTYRSTGATPSINIKNHSYGYDSPYITNSDEVQALNNSLGAGTIHVISVGNGRDFSGDSNKSDALTTPGAIGVAALGGDGTYAYYSSFGANVVVTAPSSGWGPGILTTDRQGTGLHGGYNDSVGSLLDGDSFADYDYTSTFGGTSSASPLVAGVLALAKQANPNLDGRMAKHLLARTSDSSIDISDNSLTSDGGWKTNAAGFRFNQNYGFGLIDADALTLAATQYAGVSAASYESLSQTVGLALPDAVVNDVTPGAITQTFNLYEPGELEELLIELDAEHSYRGDLQAQIVSPAGTSSRLMLRDIGDPTNDLSWEFLSNAFWGENPVGTWTLTLEDWFTQDVGSWNGFSVTAITGSLIAVPEPSTLLLAVLALVAITPKRN